MWNTETYQHQFRANVVGIVVAVWVTSRASEALGKYRMNGIKLGRTLLRMRFYPVSQTTVRESGISLCENSLRQRGLQKIQHAVTRNILVPKHEQGLRTAV